MRKLRNEGLDFVERAPRRWDFEAAVAAAPDVVFDAIAADPSTWRWFPGFSDGGYEGNGPHGVGSHRFVILSRTTYRETILAWDAPTRWAYRVDETPAPLAHALVEDWHVSAGADSGSVVRWTFAIDPKPLFKIASPVASLVMGRLFRRAMRNLSETLAEA